MPSTSAALRRRNPQQARATARRATFLEVAARLFGELGYEGVTMTLIAEQAKSSIGTLYDYFPDKESLALTLLAQYAEEKDAHWEALIGQTAATTKTELAELFLEGILAFVDARPGYLSLLRAPIAYSRTRAARQPLRRTIGQVLQKMNPKLADDQAFLGAQVIVELLKGFLSVYRDTAPADRPRVAEEFKKLMRLYLAESLF